MAFFRHIPKQPADCERLFEVSPPVVLSDGQTASYVVAGYPLASLAGLAHGLQVFAADAAGHVIDWGEPVWDIIGGDDLAPAEWPADWLDVVLQALGY